MFLLFWASILFPFTFSHASPTIRDGKSFDFEQRGGRIAPKVMIISMFTPEQDVWFQHLDFVHNISIPGASPLYPAVHCVDNFDVCQFTTGESEINAAGSTSALFMNPQFDLRQTYFMIAGIAGGNPYHTTIGSVTFGAFTIQGALQYELDSREIPQGWPTGYWGFGTAAPGQYPGYENWYGTEVFALNVPLRDKVFLLTSHVQLQDSATSQEYRKKFDYAPANEPPAVVKCDGVTSDVWYTGNLMGEAFGNVTQLWTNGSATYCSTAQEDSATLSSALRAHLAGLVDYGRFIMMRSIANLDRPAPNLDPYADFETDHGGFEPSLNNLYIAGWPVVQEIVENWDSWRQGVAHQKGFYGDVLGTIAEY